MTLGDAAKKQSQQDESIVNKEGKSPNSGAHTLRGSQDLDSPNTQNLAIEARKSTEH